jgi:hypothetical protein
LSAASGSSSRTLDGALREATDYGLLALGEIVRATIYERIERKHRVKREEIPEKLEVFHKGLQMMLGPHPAMVVEGLIARDFYDKRGLNFTIHGNWTIVDYVDDVKKRMRV